MSYLLARILGLYTKGYVEARIASEKERIYQSRKKYYQEALKTLAKSGKLPPNVDLQLPKKNVLLKNIETGEIVAENGKWLRLPNDNEPLQVVYIKGK